MKSISILLIEDNPDDEALALRAFRKNNINSEVAVARDGVAATEYLFGNADSVGCDLGNLPGLILLDLKLPKMDGLEVLRRIRANSRTQHLPIVVLTSSKSDEDLIASYGLGANSYIRKLVDFNAFSAVIRDLGLYWTSINVPPPVRHE